MHTKCKTHVVHSKTLSNIFFYSLQRLVSYIFFIWYIAFEFIHLQQIYLEYRSTASFQAYIRSKRF